MKIAVISDIHGNLPALEAVMEDIKNRNIDKIICLGDIIGKGPSSNEAIDICKQECEVVIKGNWDYFVHKSYTDMLQGQVSDVTERNRWYVSGMSPHNLEYLGALPHSTEFYIGGKLARLFHAHPQNYNRYYQNSPIEQRRELFGFGDFSLEKKSADIAIYADIHSAYLQMLNTGFLINVGSVGNPLEIPESSYVILSGDENSSFGVEFMRVRYDIEKAVAMAIEANVPDLDGYISELKTAKYFRRG